MGAIELYFGPNDPVLNFIIVFCLPGEMLIPSCPRGIAPYLSSRSPTALQIRFVSRYLEYSVRPIFSEGVCAAL